ncbi:hypothetical protein [Pseudoalteromonas sp. P1-9]|uniref:hypothetical protein n=1 Tax=Pseudoalteromonas sp. P1-9 TaxID=1710354 RepID=UPI000AD41FF8|nr:hypothetical protein [Pseudoalteromonas sp. P1-9]
MIDQLHNYKPKLDITDLVMLIRNNPTITQQQLISQTNSTLVEARKAFDVVEWGE